MGCVPGLVKLLLQNGACIDRVDGEGNSARGLAVVSHENGALRFTNTMARWWLRHFLGLSGMCFIIHGNNWLGRSSGFKSRIMIGG
jgi:hypothetical protein